MCCTWHALRAESDYLLVPVRSCGWRSACCTPSYHPSDLAGLVTLPLPPAGLTDIYGPNKDTDWGGYVNAGGCGDERLLLPMPLLPLPS